MTSQRRVGVVLGYANIISKNLVNLIYTPMLLSFVGQAEYGVYQACSSFVFSLTLLSFGFSQSYVRFYVKKRSNGGEKDVRRLNGVYLVLYAVVSAAALVIGLSFAANAEFVFSPGFTAEQIVIAKIAMAFMAANIAIVLFNSVFDSYVLANEEFRFQQTRQLAITLASPFVAYVLLVLGFGVVGVAAAPMAVNGVLFVINAMYCVRRLKMRFNVLHFDGECFKSIAAFSSWIFANQICDLVNQNVPNIVLGALSGASAAAVYAVAVLIRNVFISLSTAISNVFIPEINKIVASSNDNHKLSSLMAKTGKFQMMVFCWTYGAFAVLGQFFIGHWAGSGFSDAYWLVLLTVFPLGVSLTQNTGIEIQRAKNMHRARSIAMLITALFNVAFTVAVSPIVGYWAPALAYAVGEALCKGVFMNWYYHKCVGLNIFQFWKTCFPVVLSGAVVTVACFAGTVIVPVDSWPWFLLWGFVFTLLYLAALWLFVMGANERSLIKYKVMAYK